MWWVKKGVGCSCLLNHISVKGIALTPSPLCAPSIYTNLLIDRCSSKTAPHTPQPGPQDSQGMSLWPYRLLLGAPTTTEYSGSRLIRICHADLKTTCSGCEYIMKIGGNRVSSASFSLNVLHSQLQQEQLQVGGLKLNYWVPRNNNKKKSTEQHVEVSL